jgi:calcineurin-like phosphoesterase family protein
MYFFTADEHYGHTNIIKYCHRPFQTVEEMDNEIIRSHNAVVGEDDTVIHVGDFCFGGNRYVAEEYRKRLMGNHIFLQGSHDRCLGDCCQVWEKKIDGQYVVACHYAMRVWPRSHYGSWQVYGHSHGGLPPIGKQWDVGVDNNDFRPVSFTKLCEIMSALPDNPNLICPRA